MPEHALTADETQLPDDWQPSDDLTQWQWDDCMIWEMKARIEDLEPRNIATMWRKLQEYRYWIEREEQSVLALLQQRDALERDNADLRARLRRFEEPDL